jgi:hypothetical protein
MSRLRKMLLLTTRDLRGSICPSYVLWICCSQLMLTENLPVFQMLPLVLFPPSHSLLNSVLRPHCVEGLGGQSDISPISVVLRRVLVALPPYSDTFEVILISGLPLYTYTGGRRCPEHNVESSLSREAMFR